MMLEYRFRIKHVVNGKDQMVILCDENDDKIDQVKHLQIQSTMQRKKLLCFKLS